MERFDIQMENNMYTCNGRIEIHMSDADYNVRIINQLIQEKKEFVVFGSWQDPTCYFSYSKMNGFGGWFYKQYGLEETIKRLEDK